MTYRQKCSRGFLSETKQLAEIITRSVSVVYRTFYESAAEKYSALIVKHSF